mgnify:CR=1 FL=1
MRLMLLKFKWFCQGIKMIDVLQEITVWDDPIPNHIYHVNGSGKLVAFDNGTGLKTFNRPLQFDKARRKFKKLEQFDEKLPADAITVQGSNGKVYTIVDGKCSCPGFTFRGSCKHVK